MTKLCCVLYEGQISNGDKTSFFIVTKYIIFVNIINNVTDVIVPGFTSRHHGRNPLLWRVFSRGSCRLFQCLWKFCFYPCCRGSYIPPFLCYFWFLEKFSLSSELNMTEVRERILLVGGSYKTSDTTSWWMSKGLPGAKKRYFFHILWCTVQ